MYTFPPHGERKRTTYLQLEISVFLRETNTSTIFTCTSLLFFFLSSFVLDLKKGTFLMKGFHCNKKKKGREENKEFCSFKVKLWTATAFCNRATTRGTYAPPVCSQSPIPQPVTLLTGTAGHLFTSS